MNTEFDIENYEQNGMAWPFSLAVNYENMENRDGRSKTLCTCQNDRREFWDNQLKMKQHSIL